MAIAREVNGVVFICETCEDELDTTTHNFKLAVETLKDNEWRLFKNDSDRWVHYCPNCRG